jgi:hypothetical protein
MIELNQNRRRFHRYRLHHSFSIPCFCFPNSLRGLLCPALLLLCCDGCRPRLGNLMLAAVANLAATALLGSASFSFENIRALTLIWLRTMARTKQTARKQVAARQRPDGDAAAGEEQAHGRKLMLAGRSGQVVL